MSEVKKRTRKPKPRTTQRGIAMDEQLIPLVCDGVKTQTRRIQGLDEINIAPNRYTFEGFRDNLWHFSRGNVNKSIKCPFGLIGDFLYIKEAYHQITDNVFVVRSQVSGYKWKPGRFMPKKAAKTWVQITQIGVQRLDEISVDDIHAEGVVDLSHELSRVILFGIPNDPRFDTTTPRGSWEKLFASAYGPNTVEQNPWVWVIKFQLTEKPALK